MVALATGAVWSPKPPMGGVKGTGMRLGVMGVCAHRRATADSNRAVQGCLVASAESAPRARLAACDHSTGSVDGLPATATLRRWRRASARALACSSSSLQNICTPPVRRRRELCGHEAHISRTGLRRLEMVCSIGRLAWLTLGRSLGSQREQAREVWATGGRLVDVCSQGGTGV